MIAYENEGPVATVDFAYPDEGDAEPVVTRDRSNATVPRDPDVALPMLEMRLAGLGDATRQVSHEEFFAWRFCSQSAVRSGNWKLLRCGGVEDMLFDLESDPGETRNVIKDHASVASDLHQKLESWSRDLDPPGLPVRSPSDSEKRWYEFFFSAH